MSSPISIRDVETLVEGIVKKGVAYAVGLITFLCSDRDYSYRNVVDTLEPAFGPAIASKVYDYLTEAFKDINMYARIVVEGREIWLDSYLRQRVLREGIAKIILSDAEKRL